ncbi:hypothetical protein [Flagellimonas nanhaiensis]|uniref:Uncharacterized protein n=1 Tax=Flagellimonas nanhaiensis TaxID=2292706 RepID=A0A371JLA9_9FLAO|nr:hypothetical protein [Allomuricauda nanhaiensis]RDY57736.1 hypothetical protein DX873_17715 [Allomuricauda nanhaiensis]
MDIETFNNLSKEERQEYFWDFANSPIDSLKTLNFDYYLFRQENTGLHFELRVGKIPNQTDVKCISENVVIERYGKKHQNVDGNPWD